MTHSNPRRGCGTKKEGGGYLSSGEGVAGGSLSILASWYGQHWGNLDILDMSAVKERGQQVIAPATSIIAGTYQEIAPTYHYPLYKQLTLDGKDFALVDYVGAESYTVHKFVKESIEHGISRRIPVNMMADLVPKLPFPIIFVQKLPFWTDDKVSNAVWDALLRWDESVKRGNDWHETAVWSTRGINAYDQEAEWGLFPYLYNGNNHMMNPIMRFYDDALSREDDYVIGLFKKAKWIKSAFASSWVVKLDYVIAEEDKTSKLNELADAGIHVDYLE